MSRIRDEQVAACIYREAGRLDQALGWNWTGIQRYVAGIAPRLHQPGDGAHGAACIHATDAIIGGIGNVAIPQRIGSHKRWAIQGQRAGAAGTVVRTGRAGARIAGHTRRETQRLGIPMCGKGRKRCKHRDSHQRSHSLARPAVLVFHLPAPHRIPQSVVQHRSRSGHSTSAHPSGAHECMALKAACVRSHTGPETEPDIEPHLAGSARIHPLGTSAQATPDHHFGG